MATVLPSIPRDKSPAITVSSLCGCVNYKAHEELVILPFDCSTTSLSHQVVHLQRRAAVSPLIAELLLFLKQERTEDQVRFFVLTGYPSADPEQVIESCRSGAISAFLGHSNGQQGPSVVQRAATSYLRIRFTLIPAAAVTRIVDGMGWLFDARVATPLVVAVAAVQCFFPHFGQPVVRLAALSNTQWIQVWVGAYAAVLLHEFGHSAACRRFKCPPGSIGFGIYWVIPVFYSDTSSSWALPRAQRMAVDLAGIYFHLLAGTACILLNLRLQSPVLDLVAHAVILSTFVNINPFLRFDGYWFVTDLTGIPSLRTATTQLFNYVWSRIRHPYADEPVPVLLRTSRLVQAVFALYAIASTAYFARLFWRLCHSLPRFVTALPEQARRLRVDAHQHMFGRLAHDVMLFIATVWSLYFLSRLLCSKARRVSRVGTRFIRNLNANGMRGSDAHS